MLSKIELYQQVVIILIIIGIIVYLQYQRYADILKQKRMEQEAFETVLKEGFQEGLSVDDINKAFKDAGDKMKDGFEQVGNFFKDIFERIKKFGEGLGLIFKGIGEEIAGVFIGTWYAFDDTITIIIFTFYYIITHFICGIKFLSNIRYCFIYYIIDIFCNIMYLPISLAIWFMQFVFGIDFKGFEYQMWRTIYYINDVIYGNFGFNIIRWPHDVRDKCYNCERLKLSAYERATIQMESDFKNNVIPFFRRGIDDILQGGRDIAYAFSKHDAPKPREIDHTKEDEERRQKMIVEEQKARQIQQQYSTLTAYEKENKRDEAIYLQQLKTLKESGF